MTRTPRVATAALSSVVVLSLLSAAPTATAAPTPAAATVVKSATGASFYDPPADLPEENGALVRTEPMKDTSRLSGTATRLMYRTTDETGQATAVSGAYIEPSKPWRGQGDRPLVSFAVGTQGVADACAPSKTLESAVNVEDGKFMFGYEVPSINGFLDEGVAVVLTDYIGLGTTDRIHTYANRIDQAHAVLDAARAALALPGTSITSSSAIGLSGYSQGGGAAGAAAELAPTYAPDLNLVGAYVGGPPANLFDTMEHIDGTLLSGAILWSINATRAHRPEIEPELKKVLNTTGLRELEKAKDQCIGDALLATGSTKSTRWTRSGKSAAVEVAANPVLMKGVEDQRIGRLKPTIPVQVLTGTKDDVVPHGQAKQLALDWCAQGANVTYEPVVQLVSSGGLMLTHLGPQMSEKDAARSWLIDRLNGRVTNGNCNVARLLP